MKGIAEQAQSAIIRRGRKEDGPYIREFTKDTFDWGDYVGDAFPEWLDSGCDVFVAEIGGVPVGVTCVTYPTESEAWFQGIRVHPDYRRMGIATRLTEASISAARERGASVCRADIDAENVKSQRLAQSMGFRLATRHFEYEIYVAEHPIRKSPKSEAVVKAGPEDAEALMRIASGQIRYLGMDYVWSGASQANMKRFAALGGLLMAKDGASRPVAGAIIDDGFQSGSEGGQPARLSRGLTSLFGSPSGIIALVDHAAAMIIREAEEKQLRPGTLYVNVEGDSPAHEVVKTLVSPSAKVWRMTMWELPLRRNRCRAPGCLS